ncbi:MAG TPA: hypothetical protein VM870_08645, partial [Pyrinomonadaceae bacterium]|nr:hypothetical protein [Pyrinomonadaceae bacterium]
LEFRITDVCLTIDEAVMVAGLIRSLARTCYEQAEGNVPVAHARPELMRAAKWRAARFGLSADLIDVEQRQSVPARQLLEKMLLFLRPSLEDFGEWDEVSSLVEKVITNGTGAERQRQAFTRSGNHEELVDYIVSETAAGAV